MRPYDQILIDGAVEHIPDAIVDQLAEGGRLGAALVDRGITRLIVGRKAGGAFGYLSLGDAGIAGSSRLRPAQGIHFLRGTQCFASFITGSLIAGLLTGTASADTLRDALVSSYHTNPTLTAQREELKATDAGVAIAQVRRAAADQRHRRAQSRPVAQRRARHQRQPRAELCRRPSI